MSAYDNHPRVERICDTIFAVNGCQVYATDEGKWRQWWVANRYGDIIGGPYTSTDEAIHALVGDPL